MSEIIKNIFERATIHKNTLPLIKEGSTEFAEGDMELSFDLGNWKTRQWFFDQISVKYYSLSCTSPFGVEHNQNADIVHLHFNLSGNFRIQDKRQPLSFGYGTMQHNMSYLNGFDASIHYETGVHESIFFQLPKAIFLLLIENTSDPLMAFGEKIQKGAPVFLSTKNALINWQMNVIVQSILNCRYSGGIKKLFFLSKCFELMVLQAEAFELDANRKYIYCKTDFDKERIFFAREYVTEHHSDPPSLSELAKIIGINEFKLKKGFKEVFNTTVFGYLTDYKLELAKNELAFGSKTASDLAVDLGYSSLQHFSKAFKKKFGISPGKKTL